MGRHKGLVRVYGPTRLRWLAPVARLDVSLWILTLVALTILKAANRNRQWLVVGTVLALVVVVWLPWWVARLASPSVRISDRYRWDQIEKACAKLVKYLPKASGQRRRAVRSRVEATRWSLARAMCEVDRLSILQRDGVRPGPDPTEDDATRGQRLATLQAHVEEWIGWLRDLAERSASIAGQDRRRREAARLLVQVDASIADDAAPDVRPDPAGDILQRAESTLDGYRELLDRSNPDLPGPRKGGGR